MMIVLPAMLYGRKREATHNNTLRLSEHVLSILSCSVLLLKNTNTWSDLKPPTTTYNHLQPPQKFKQPSTTA